MTVQFFSRKTISSIVTIAFVGMISPISAVHAVATITEDTAVPNPTNNPTYTFTSDAIGTIAYGGPCTSIYTAAVVGPNTIVFDTGAEGNVSGCTVSVDDGGGFGNTLNLTDFFIDNTPPTIQTSGPAYISYYINSAFFPLPPSYTFTDNNDPGGLATLTITGITATGSVGPFAGPAVDTSYTGTYTYRYSKTDMAGNVAISLARTVEITSGDIPVLTLQGTTPMQIALGTPYVEDGATATDTEDDLNGIPLNVTISGSVDFNTVGTYTLTYEVVDSNGNGAIPVTRTVDVLSGDIPVITMNGITPILHELGTAYSDLGATATDLTDGDLTTSIVLSGSVDSNVPGTYYIDYNVIDSELNPAPTVTRTIIVADRTAPVVTPRGSGASEDILRNTVYTELDADWTDAIDGAGTAFASGIVDTNVLGSYPVTYEHIDAAGNIGSATRTVNVVTGDLPVITLSGANPMNVLYGDIYSEPGFVNIMDTEDGDITASGFASGIVPQFNTGSYTITYSVTDSNMNSVSTGRVVNVIDNVAPVLTINGTDVTMDAGTPYVDDGASWTDNADGSGTVSYSGPFNSNAAGVYTLTYNKTDSSGNVGIPVTRTVTVIGSAVVPQVQQAGPGGGGGSAGSAASDTYGVNLDSAPVENGDSSIAEENLLVPSIARQLRNSIAKENYTKNNATTEEVSVDGFTRTHNITEPITDYICPVVEQFYAFDDNRVINIEEGEYTPYVQSLLMYRGLDNEDLAMNFSQRYFASKGFGIAKIDETFEGDRAITRAEYIKMLVRALSCHYTFSESEQIFSDVGQNAWYSEYINFATNNGWINGYDDGTFGPHSLISRGEMAQILGKAIQIETDVDTIESFYDVPMIDPVAPYIYALRDHGIIEGRTESFYDLDSPVTRNEVAKIFATTFLNIGNN